MVKLTARDHDIVARAVAEAEAGTDGEIVTVVAPMSDRYNDVPLHWAILAMFLKLATIAASPEWVGWMIDHLSGGWSGPQTLRQTLTATLAMIAFDFLLVRLAVGWRPIRLALTPGAIKTRRVRRRAVELFRVGAEGRTRAKTAVLIYLSLGERRAELVADAAIAAKVAPEIWGEAMAALVAAVKEGRPGEGMAAAVAQVGVVLAAHFPRSDDDRDELPDRLVEL